MNREKDKLAAYLKSIQVAVEETKTQLIGRADNRSIDAALRQVVISILSFTDHGGEWKGSRVDLLAEPGVAKTSHVKMK